MQLLCLRMARGLCPGSSDNTVKIWDANTGQELCTLSGHTNWVKTVAVFADGTRVVSGSGSLFNREGDFTVKIWDTESGAERCTLSGHSRMVTAVAVFPDDKRGRVGEW